MTTIVVAVLTTTIGPLVMAYMNRRWSEEDRELGDQAVDQLKTEVAALREQLASSTPPPAPTPLDGCSEASPNS